ncbi:MAG: hypothetical protein NTV73_15950 [Hyphomicrobiales bacterium]|nr:hypothetical protein [Hyphomicrobiales bacterium]
MKRLMLALAGYAFYRWWTSQDADPATSARPTQPARKPSRPAG